MSTANIVPQVIEFSAKDGSLKRLLHDFSVMNDSEIYPYLFWCNLPVKPPVYEASGDDKIDAGEIQDDKGK